MQTLNSHKKTTDMTRYINLHFPLIVITLLIIATSVFCGCTRTIYQPIEIEKTRTDSTSVKAEFTEAQFSNLVNILQERVNTRDSVVIRDSVIMVINEAGNIISKETFHDRDHNSLRDEAIIQMQAKYDSIFNAQREEITAILEQLQQTPVPVERQLTKWEKVKQDVGGMAIGILIAVIAIAVIWLIKKIKR